MLVLGISGRKQSGKTTAGNFILSLYLAKFGVSEKIYLDDDGNIIISDLLGDTSYEGIFDIKRVMYTRTVSPEIMDILNLINNQVKIYNFADILKTDICMNILGLTYDQCYGTDDNKNEPTNIQWDGKKLSARDVMQVVGTDIFRKLDTEVWVRTTLNRIVADQPNLAIITDCRFPNEVDAIKQIDGKIIRLTRDPFKSDHLSEKILDKNNYDWSNFDFILDNQESSLYDQLTELKTILEKLLNLS